MRGGMAATPSAAARVRMESGRWERWFTASWDRVLMIHLEVDPGALALEVPFALDLWEGRAFVTLVAFTMRGMRPVVGGALGAWMFGPIATHRFLNVRTYVRHGAESGILFLAEWLSSGLAVLLGPGTFGLPYRHGGLEYAHDWERGGVAGRVQDFRTAASLGYCATLDRGNEFGTCESGTHAAWLMERYTAFTECGGTRRFFRVWHEPWPQVEVSAELLDRALLEVQWPWMREARVVGANFSPGLTGVWMGRPHRLPADQDSESGVT